MHVYLSTSSGLHTYTHNRLSHLWITLRIRLSFWEARELRPRVLTAELEQTDRIVSRFLPSFLSICTVVFICALVCDIKVVSDPSRHFSQYSQCLLCHFYLNRNSFALLTFILRKAFLTNEPVQSCYYTSYK